MSLLLSLYIYINGAYTCVMYSGVGKSWNKSMDVFHWTSMVARGMTIDFQMFIFALFGLCRSTVVGHNTYDTAFKILYWSFYWMYLGKWPTHTWDGHEIRGPQAGKDLAGGFFCVIWNLKGDLDHFAKAMALRHYASSQPCFFCPADTSADDVGGVPWTDFRKGVSNCFKRIYSKANWHRLFPTHNLLFDLPGLSILTVSADHMHCKHMGVDQYFFGSVLMLLAYYVMPGAFGEGECCQRYAFREV